MLDGDSFHALASFCASKSSSPQLYCSHQTHSHEPGPRYAGVKEPLRNTSYLHGAYDPMRAWDTTSNSGISKQTKQQTTYNEKKTYKTNTSFNGRINSAKESRHTAIQHTSIPVAQDCGA